MPALDIVNAALAGDKETMAAAFNAEISARVTDALEVKKVEFASSLLGTEETTNEVETVEGQVDGSSDAAAAETAAAEAASTESAQD